MRELRLEGLEGRNPLGLFAALGALDVATRHLPGEAVTLRWTEELIPTAVLGGLDSKERLLDLCEADLDRWHSSPVLTWGPDGIPLEDLKPEPEDLLAWIDAALDEYRSTGDRTDIDLLSALVADGATAGKGDSKPTHFHFTAGQQRFLNMVRDLLAGMDRDRFAEALFGPWRYDSSLPVLSWDVRGERIYALRGFDPSKDKRLGVPGADWLGFLGLRFFPVSVRDGDLRTTGCSRGWKKGHFTWPLWNVDLEANTVMSLVADDGLDSLSASLRLRLGVHHLLRAPIRRSDQGGYGSFGAPEPVLAPARAPTSQRRVTTASGSRRRSR